MRCVISPVLLSLLMLVCVLSAAAFSEEGRFDVMGIGGGGQMYGAGISPHDPNLMHVSCDMGTFYATEDGGKRWRMIEQLQMSGITSCRPAYHPKDPNVVYMPYYRGVNQLRISHDRGKTWEVLCESVPWGNPKGRDKFDVGVIAINLDPDGDKLIFASTAEGLYRSVDGGKTFAKCPGVEDIALWTHVSPASPADARYCVAGATSGVYVSDDGGRTWTKRENGLPGDMLAFCAGTDPKTKQVRCYAAFKGTVHASDDGGKTFRKSEGLPDATWRFVSACESAPEIAYATNFGADFGTWKTVDGGRTWTRVFGSREPGIRWGWLGTDYTKGFGGRANCVSVAPGDPDLVLYVNTGELFITRDGGKTWCEGCSRYYGPDPDKVEKNQSWGSVGIEVALPTDMVWDPFARDRVYLIYGDIGFLVSVNRGDSWRRSVAGIPKEWTNRMWQLVCDPDRKGVLYAACSGQHGTLTDIAQIKHKGGVVVSVDHGETWKVSSEGLPTDKTVCTGLCLDPGSPKNARVLYCVMQNDGVHKSVDGGATWTRKSNGLGRKDNMNVELVHMTSDGTLYALVIGRSDGWTFRYPPGGLWRSTDGAESWEEVTRGSTLAYPKYFAVDPRDAKHILLGTTQAPHKESAGLWETRDGGATWKQLLDADKLGKDLYGFVHSGDIVFHPTIEGLVYYSTKTHGLWISADNAKTWKRMLGVPRLATGRIIVDPQDPNVIYVCSVGLWKGPAKGY